MIPPTGPPCGHPYAGPPVEGCALCLIRHWPFHRERWAGGSPPLPKRTSRPLCLHLGDIVPTASRRTHYQCDRGHGTVCPCRECHGCADYEPDGEGG
jgi:hypothetical protein